VAGFSGVDEEVSFFIPMPLNTRRKRSRSNNVAITKKRKATVNPFEVRLNRKKHQVIGQKTKSDGAGRPGLSRSKAIEKVETYVAVLTSFIVCKVLRLHLSKY